MITGFKGNIKVWQFNNGSMYELSKLEVKSDLITCLIYSKKNQWFVSGDNSGGIQLWK
jgi:WD40 repeat protein